jgi:AhpD family alkylhydroperoxidase
MQSRMKSPAVTLPGVLSALRTVAQATEACGVPRITLELVHLRAGQLNGCSVCVDMHARALKKLGESDVRLFAVAAWREATYYTQAERAALALAEDVTQLRSRDPLPDAVWDEAARHFDEAALGALVISVALANLWNRVNVSTRQVTGDWVAQHL